eukprot:CAMPEP_0167756368 /NCGR_PEP_ID=MMETSP0110_2-20121227/9348_1 /TAXON_ID=629695 /ORGANISM="Gymnochlora sp., Strain CCMP2014" /LENGTH=283 /DNA_ID=CAMNT_0007642473 /DNA_START=146 /DNA_END=997 /DNA_ORIENTATION=-
MSKVRVFVTENGNSNASPVIVVIKDGMSREDFFAKAAAKLKTEKKYTRCFLLPKTEGEKPAEIDDLDEVDTDDKVIVSTGEDLKTTGMLSSGLSSMAIGASSLYASVSGFAKSKMSEDMKKQFEDAEKKVSDTMAPAVAKVKEVSAPAIDFMDKKLDVAAEKIKEKKTEFMNSETGKYINQKIVKPATEQSKIMMAKASAELKKLNSQSKEKMVPLTEFMKSMKEKMGKEWDEKLAPAMKKMYEQAKEKSQALTGAKKPASEAVGVDEGEVDVVLAEPVLEPN